MSYNPFSLEGKTVLVTGASSGIGRSTAIECSKLGAQVFITGRNKERLTQTLNELEGEGHRMIICNLDDESEINQMIENVPEIQGLVNNAGIGMTKPLQFIGVNDLDAILKTNTIAPISLLQKLLKKKKLRKGASVVFTSSMAGLGNSAIGNSLYTASKGAISAFVRCAALELAQKSIRVNAICPAMVRTALINSGSITQEQLDEDVKNYPLGRYGNPNDIAWAIIYLLSDASSWITGDNLIIDGGLTLK